MDAIAGTTTRFYYDDQRIVLQTSVDTSETDLRYFIFGNYIDEVLLMHNLSGTNTGDFYYGHDHLYSPAVLFAYDSQQQSWEPCERYEYDVYGACRILTSGFSLLSSSQYGNPYYFTGRELDFLDSNALKLMYYRARSYDPQTGRFLQRDPLGINPAGRIINPFKPLNQYKDGLNIYEYVRSMPLLKTDSYGLAMFRYGNWCGGGWSGGKTGKEPPIDGMDSCCMQHDKDYEEADKNYEKCIENAKKLGKWWCGKRRDAKAKCGEDRDCAKKKANQKLLGCLDTIGPDPTGWTPPAPDEKKAFDYYSDVCKWFGQPKNLPGAGCK